MGIRGKDKIEKKIEYVEKFKQEKKNMPKEVTQEMLKRICGNLIKAIAILVYFGILNLAYMKIDYNNLTEYIKICAGAFLISGLITLEIAYKKDKRSIAISGIELLFLSFHSLTIIYIITIMKYNFKFYVLTSSYLFTIYYVLRGIMVETKQRKKYAESLSDISEIVKKEEPQKKEAKKRNVKNNIITKKVENRKTVEKKKQTRPKSAKRGRTKKKKVNKEEVKAND